jgi:hypothetical protein
MRIKAYLILLVIASLFFYECTPPGGSPGSEIGDVVFRPYGIAIVGSKIGHAALYRNSNSKTDWDPESPIIDSDLEHSVIQASGEEVVLGWQSFSYFLSKLEQRGKGYTYSEPLSIETRKKLINHAIEQYGASYPHFFEEWYYPKIMTPNSPTEQGCFRCDGFVEYVYDQEGLGFFDLEEQEHCFFFNETEWLGFPVFFPEALRERMKPDNPCPPELNIISPVNGSTAELQTLIKVSSDDGPNGSGIDRIEIYIDDSRILKDDEDSDGQKSVNHIWETQEITSGEHEIKVIAYDRAGNKTEKSLKVQK